MTATQSNVQEKLWTDNNYKGDTKIRGLAPLPVGLRGSKCKKCGSEDISGALIMPTADNSDPNILCLDCGYWCD